jgi:hypothetical protein
MSLINEALKKAQGQRPAAARPPREPQHADMPVQQPQQPKQRSMLWGFLIVIIFVGLFSAGAATFLVWQLIGQGDAENTAAAQPQPSPAAAIAAVPAPAVEPAATGPGPLTPVEPAAPAPEPELPVGQPLAAAGTEVIPPLQQEAVTESAAVRVPTEYDSAIWARLEQIEIRGIMSGGSRVLIFDTATGKTKSFQPGEMLDGALGLKVASIAPSTIIFEDHGGSPHTKSF